MTRFARSKGSNGSNKRIPEESTSWKDMKSNKISASNLFHNNRELFQTKPINGVKKNGKRYLKDNPNKIFLNGIEIELAYFDGFPIKKSDADRLKQLKKEMVSRGIPRKEIDVSLKLERRKAEKALAREKKKVCFNCRNGGHTLSECPKLHNNSNIPQFQSGICFKCGSTEHTHFECKIARGESFKFAQCFICEEQGHIAKQCPNNNRGIYPNGGACNTCGDVTHLKKDCPLYQMGQTESKVAADKIDERSIESLEIAVLKSPTIIKKPKKVIF